MIESDADRLAILQAFGIPVTAERGTLLGIFDAQYVDAAGIDQAAPMLEVRSSDVAALQLRKGSTLTVEAAAYRVRRIEPDGTGMTRLILEE